MRLDRGRGDGNLLRAQTAAAGIAVNAQLRADETRLRQSAQRGDVIKDLLKMIAEDRAKMKQEQEQASGSVGEMLQLCRSFRGKCLPA